MLKQVDRNVCSVKCKVLNLVDNPFKGIFMIIARNMITLIVRNIN